MKESVACVVRRPGSAREVLAVLRPEDDPELPGVWGLPAASRRPAESWEDAIARVGREKLGVSLRPLRMLADGEETRPGYELRMRLYETALERGEPRVPQPATGVTQYAAWRWAQAATLEPGARRGSLCCRLLLDAEARAGSHEHGDAMLRSCSIVRALRREPVERVPLWLMRQAGRYLPEYRALRKRHTILELTADAELAAEVTLMPMRRFDLDAAIVFADILLPLPAMGVPFRFEKGEGPAIESPVRRPEDVARLRTFDPEEALAPTLRAIALVRDRLPREKALLGFAGAPFTLASYMIEGGASRDYLETKSLFYRHPEAWTRMMETVRAVTRDYLSAQVRAGADAVQLFDSWVGCLAPEDYRAFVLPHTTWIVGEMKRRHPETPLIHFGTGTATLLPAMLEAGADAISVDWRVPLSEARRIAGDAVALQGNLDPALLAAGPLARLRERVRAIVAEGSGGSGGGRRAGYVFNLGHGVLPSTPVEHVAAVVEEVHAYREVSE